MTIRAPFRYVAWAYAILLLALLPFDWHFAERAMAGRANTFIEMRGEHLERFQGKDLIAGDVGFIGYFTGANICDLAGLVNGRDAAKLTQIQRIERCAARRPQLLFLSPNQASDINRVATLKNWMVCARMDFTNLRSDDTHYLMIRDTTGTLACPNGSAPIPAGKIMPALAE